MSNSVVEKKKEYYTAISKLLDSEKPKVAYHFNCTDGTIVAALANYSFDDSDILFLPLDYELINDSPLHAKLQNTTWKAVLDLAPFNLKTTELYMDHHISNVGKTINALKIFYIAGAPSTAYVYYKHYRSDLPSHLVELVKITEITDTASYTTPAPLTLNSSLEEYSWEDIIWFVEDACKTALTIDEHNELIQIFSLEGWQGLWKNNILSRIKSLRNERTISKKLVEAIEIKDFIIVVDKPEHYNMAYIAHELMKKGAKGAAYLTEFPTYVKISLRLSKNLSEQEIDRYRVDLLAKRLNGGGHKPAAGAQTRTLTEALEKIELWAKTNDFTFEIIDLRNRKKK
ncbi:MAG: hypothetical protein ACTSYD_04000 [Candidatus Heimdallarchaeaceae archaeon]